MESSKIQDVHFNEEAASFNSVNESHRPCKVHERRQNLKNAALFASVMLLWWWLDVIPNTFRLHWEYWGVRSITDGSEDGRHMSFDTITPSEQLEWHRCFYNTCCARLTVPMDYNRPLNASASNPKVHIALVLVPGKHKGPQIGSTSPLLLNPGGPGGSGTMLALGAGSALQTIVGEDQDVIGFDPRGIGATTPRADCFSFPSTSGGENQDDSLAGSEDYFRGNFHRMMWQTAGRDIGIVNSNAETLKVLDSRARTVAKLCEEKDKVLGENSILRYVHTPSVARDMLSIVDAWDEWRDRIGDSKNDQVLLESSESDASLDTKGKLVYWGFSYGTLLGATFAAMFPDRVGRVILDGVVDADHYVSPVWRSSIQDADAVSSSFSTYCHAAKSDCLFYQPGDSRSSIDSRFQSVLDHLASHPATLMHPFTHQPLIITHSHLRMLLFSALYSPTMVFPFVAEILSELYYGRDEVLAEIFWLPEPEPACAVNISAEFLGNEAQAAIMCSDKRYPYNDTLPELQQAFEEMANQSSWADVWMSVMIVCNTWSIKAVDPPMRWDDHPSHKADPIKTSFPLLFISNTADPVTPLAAGVKMARKFVGAGLVEQHSEGHCSLAAVSHCTWAKIRAYLTDGKVPPHPIKGSKGRELIDGQWDKCIADEWPFHRYDGINLVTIKGEDGMEIKRTLDAAKVVQREFGKMKKWGQVGGFDVDVNRFESTRKGKGRRV